MKKEIPQDLQKVFDWIDAHREECISDLVELVQQPSVSAQKWGLEECADLVLKQMDRDGIKLEKHAIPDGPPVIIGVVPSKNGSQKVMGAYAHYDVQPPEPLEKWVTPPFSADIRDGRIWGRGATDNKSGVVSFMKAVKAFEAVTGDVPVNVKFIVEGEEEIGSPHLGNFVKDNPDLFKCDAMHCLDGGMNVALPVPEIDLGLKAILYVELIARGAKSDLHSLNAPLVPQPAWELVRALNTLVDENRHILIDDWYDGLWEMGPEENGILQDKVDRMDIQKMLDDFGIEKFALDRTPYEALKARSYEPTCNICGLTAGYQGPGSKTIVPCEARAKIDFRIPPLMKAGEAYDKLRKHLDKHGFEHIEIDALLGEHIQPPLKVSITEDISQAIIDAAELVYGYPPIVNGVSDEGTILQHVYMPCVFTGFAQPDCNLHAPNESISLDTLINGVKFAAAIMYEYGKRTK